MVVVAPKIYNIGKRMPENCKPFVAVYKGPITIKAGETAFKIVQNFSPVFNTHYLLIQTPDFKEDNFAGNKAYYKGLWDDTLVRIGRECEDASRFKLDPTVSRVHFSIIKRGNVFTIKDLGSSNGTSVTMADEQYPLLKEESETIRTNGEKIFSEEFLGVLGRESIGGNAGRGYASVNGVIDEKGSIICFGNSQNFPEKIKTAVKNNELFHFSIRVKMLRGVVGPDFEYLLEAYSDHLSKILAGTVADANNRGDNPYIQ